MRTLRLLPAAITAGALLLGAVPAWAETAPGFAINRFDPSERGSRWFTLESLDWSGAVRPAFGVIADQGYLPLQLHDASGRDIAVVETQFALHLGGTLTVFDVLRIGLSLPVYVAQSGTTVVSPADGRTYVGATRGGLGDLRLAADVRVFGSPKGPLRVGVGARFWLPSGEQSRYTGDGEIALQPHVDVAGDIGRFAYAARAGYLYRGLKETFGPTPIGDEIPLGASAGVKLAQGALLVGPEVQASVAVSDTGKVYSKNVVPAYWLLGGRYARQDWRVGVGAGPGFSTATGTAALKALIALEYAPTDRPAPPPPPDRDHDGVVDAEDACAGMPGVRHAERTRNGCPSDRDTDGVVDAQDACPDVAGVKSDDPRKNGCPADRDGDGVIDVADACPDGAGVTSDDPQKNGCPPDRDGDGVSDVIDFCPDVPGVASDDPQKNGCPADKDGDGVDDVVDACPDDPGPRSDDTKKNGCPAVVVEKGQIKIFEQVKFKTASAEILKESDGILDAVAKTLADHPEIARVRVEGHTDAAGSAAVNKYLSRRRAASVLAALVRRKVDARRLESQGFGQERPIDSNDTDAGRQNNRRVEFHILEPKPEAAPAPKR